MNIKNSVLDYIRYGHVQRMEEGRLARKILEWCPPGRRRRGRPQNSWIQEVTIGMSEREELAAWNGSIGRGGEGK